MVREDERGEGKWDTLTKALQLANYTIQITDNKKVFVTEHQTTTDKIVELATDIYYKAWIANRIRVGKDAEKLKERRRLQNMAIEECERLCCYIQIAKKLFHLRTKRVDYWSGNALTVQAYLKAWRDGDADCFRKQSRGR